MELCLLLLTTGCSHKTFTLLSLSYQMYLIYCRADVLFDDTYVMFSTGAHINSVYLQIGVGQVTTHSSSVNNKRESMAMMFWSVSGM